MALGDFYDKLLALTDDLAETYIGKYPGDLDTASFATCGPMNFENAMDARVFIQQVAEWAHVEKNKIPQSDSFLLNIWDEILALIFKTKYKLENLS